MCAVFLCRYERRIEYYQEKSQREKTEESHRVSELQSEIVELHKEVNNIKENRRKQIYEKEKRAKGTPTLCNLFTTHL